MKTVMIFGGSRGIGLACRTAFDAAGYRVLSTGTKASSEGIPDEDYVQVDIRNMEQVARAYDTATERVGGALDCVVANAGINRPPSPVGAFNDDDFRELVETNIVGAFHVLKGAANAVADGGAIIALSTSMVRVAVPGGGPYTATKAAVESLVRSMARELAARKIRVNAVAPGPVDTELFRAGKDDAALARSASMSPFDRVGTPDEIAEVVAFLASDKASWVHGQVVQANGGMV